MPGGKNVLYSELLLARYFSICKNPSQVPAREVMDWVKQNDEGLKIRRSEIREARKRLGIKSSRDGSEYSWTWESNQTPENVWTDKSQELWEAMTCEKETSKKF